MHRVILLLADGDLRCWADKFGLDQENDEQLTVPQKRLRDIARKMNLPSMFEAPERPKFAFGALCYLTPEHASEIEAAIQEHAVQLNPWHILVSEQHKDLVLQVGAMSRVFKLVVKGNLRHRIDKLGTEKDESQLTEGQHKLRAVAEEQQRRLESLGPDGNDGAATSAHGPRAERPSWAAGAFVYLAAEHVPEVMEAIKEQGVKLQSKHILVSEQHKDLVKQVLTVSPEGPGREAFLTRRAGAIEQVEQLPLLRLDLREVDVIPPPTRKHCATPDDKWPASSHTTAAPSKASDDSQRTWPSASDQTWPSTCAAAAGSSGEPYGWKNYDLDGPGDEDSDQAGLCDGAATSDNGDVAYKLPSLPQHLMEQRNIDLELLEFLISPDSVQQLYPLAVRSSMWLEAWRYVCKENCYVKLREYVEGDPGLPFGGPRPYCTLCSEWVDVSHLMSQRCKARVYARGHVVDSTTTPLLAAILAAAGPQDEPPAAAKSEAPRIALHSRAAAPAVDVPYPHNSSGTMTMNHAAAMVGANLQGNFRCYPTMHGAYVWGGGPTQGWQLQPGICPKPFCGLRAPGRSSSTHCCKRCESAHRAGVPRLRRDPVTGEAWKKEHGPECTVHVDRQFATQRKLLTVPEAPFPSFPFQ